MRSSTIARLLSGLPGLLAVAVLAGCGSDSTIVNPDPPDGDGPPVTIASVTLIANQNELDSDGSADITLSAFVRDASNNVVAEVPVAFSADSGLLRVLEPQTGDDGIARAELGTAGDPTNRPIVVSATAGGMTDTVTVNVAGTRLTLTPPGTLVLGDSVDLVATLVDSSPQGLAGRTVAITSANGNTLSATSLTTDSAGQVQFTVTGTQSGADTIAVSALGMTWEEPLVVSAEDSLRFVVPVQLAEVDIGAVQNVTVEWLVGGAPQAGSTVNLSTTRGTLGASSVVLDAGGLGSTTISATSAGPATLTASVAVADGPQTQRNIEFVATTPAIIVVQASKATVAPEEQSTIVATVRDAVGNPVKNKVVEFQLEDVTGGNLSVGTATTGSAGTAQTVYTGGATISGSGGVTITAVVQEDPTLENSVQLTVARREVDISIGTGNELFEPTTASYQREFIVQVTDSQGVGVPNAQVQLSVRSKYYKKGYYLPGQDTWVAVSSPSFAPPLRCADEDLNDNSELDADEDFNDSNSLEAGKVVSIAPGEVTTDESGIALVRITYAQEFGNWVTVTLQARAAVQGTEFVETADHALEISTQDASINQSPPGGGVSRFGGDPQHPNFPANLDPTPDSTDPRAGDPRLVELGMGAGRALGCRTLD